MNPELKQRLIGAAVVTALATIFVPMLFDDPKENSGKTVIEMPLPETPVKSTEISANKQQAAVKPAKTPDAATDEAAVQGEEGVTDTEMLDDADAEAAAAGGEPPVNETAATQGTNTVAETEQPIPVDEVLDTGPVDAAKPPVKRPVPVAVTPVTPKATAPVKATPATAPKQQPVIKIVDVAQPKPVVKTTTPPKPVTPPAVVATAPVAPKKPELVRYTIYAGSFNQQDNANKLMKSLREQGIPVIMETNPPGSNAKYRLKIGPSLDKKKATEFKAKLDKQGVQHTMISE